MSYDVVMMNLKMVCMMFVWCSLCVNECMLTVSTAMCFGIGQAIVVSLR